VIATIKTELISRRPWPTRLDLELALLTWIGFYNERRIHRSLAGKTPAEVTDDYHRTTAQTHRKPPNHAGAKPGTLHTLGTTHRGHPGGTWTQQGRLSVLLAGLGDRSSRR
jgi:Integrase core domain